MKKLLLISAIMLCACGSDSDGSDSDNPDISTDLTVEETKEGLKNNSIAFMDEMDSMNSCSQIDDLIVVLDCMDPNTDRPSKSSKGDNQPLFSAYFQNTVDILIAYNSDFDKNKLNALLTSNAISSLKSDDSLLDEFNNEKGTWVWNNSTKEFEKTTNGGNMIFIVDCADNNLRLEVSSFNTGYFTEDQVEVPTRVVAELKYNNTVYMTQNFSASVDDFKYLPNNLSNQTTLGCMGLNVSFQNNSNETFIASSSIAMDGDTIFEMSMTANGNFYPIDNDGDDIDEDIDEILNSLNLSIKVVNAEIQVTGDITNKIVPSEDDSSIQELVDFLNTNTEITILLDNSAVAKGEVYVDQDTYEEYNYNTGQYETVTEDVLNIHMLFNDGSTQDLEVYFDDSFNELENKLDTVLDNFENSLDEALDD